MDSKKPSRIRTLEKVSGKNIDPHLLRLFDSGIRQVEVTKAKIVKAAIEILSKEGIEGLSLEKLGRLVGISKSHVLYHYQTKDLIFRKCVEYITATAQSFVVESIAEAKTPIAHLHAYIEGNFNWASEHPEQARTFILFIARCQISEELAAFHAQIREASRLRIEAVLQELGYRESPRRTRYAQAILDLVTGSILEIMSLKGEKPEKALKERAEWVKQTCTDLVSG